MFNILKQQRNNNLTIAHYMELNYLFDKLKNLNW